MEVAEAGPKSESRIQRLLHTQSNLGAELQLGPLCREYAVLEIEDLALGDTVRLQQAPLAPDQAKPDGRAASPVLPPALLGQGKAVRTILRRLIQQHQRQRLAHVIELCAEQMPED